VLIISNKSGQLGNRLFAFAHVIAFARHNHLRVMNLAFDEYASFFVSTSRDVWCRYPPRESLFRSARLRGFLFFMNKAVFRFLIKMGRSSSNLHSVIVADLPEYDFKTTRYYDLESGAFASLCRKPFVFLFGRFFRSYQNFDTYRDDIRSYFRPTQTIETNVARVMSVARHHVDVVIGVHIRRGDYSDFVGGKYFYSLEEYCTLLVRIAPLFSGKRVRFVLCSNDVIETSKFGQLDFMCGPGGVVDDLYCLAACDYIVGPPSTFSKWASFYGSRPLFHVTTLRDRISMENFKLLPPDILFNYSFN
jgi:hypothetical protein